MRYAPFLIGRVLQVLLAVFFTALVLGPLHQATLAVTAAVPATGDYGPVATVLTTARLAANWLLALLALAMVCHAFSSLRRKFTIILFGPVRKSARTSRTPRL